MRRHGFTLIELLVVIAIIAILAAILFPMLISAKETAKRTACMSRMSQCSKAFMMYTDDYNGAFPVSPLKYTGNWPNGYNHFWAQWPTVLSRYIKNKGVLKCPSDLKPDTWATGRETSYAYPYSYFYPDGCTSMKKTIHYTSEVTYQTRHFLLLELYVWHNAKKGMDTPGIYTDPTVWEGNVVANDGHAFYMLYGEMNKIDLPSGDPLATPMNHKDW